MKYAVTIYFSQCYEVEASNEAEAERKAHDRFRNMNCLPIPDDYEVECLEEEGGK